MSVLLAVCTTSGISLSSFSTPSPAITSARPEDQCANHPGSHVYVMKSESETTQAQSVEQPTLRSSRAIYRTLFRGQCLHEPRQQVIKAGFTHPLHHGTQGFGWNCTYLKRRRRRAVTALSLHPQRTYYCSTVLFVSLNTPQALGPTERLSVQE